MPTRLAGFVYTLSTGLPVNGATVTPRASDGTAGTTGATNSTGFVAIAGLADKTWFGTVASSTQVFIPALETFVTDDIHNQSNVLSAHDVTQIRGLDARVPALVYHEFTITVENPTATENIVMRQFHEAVTITSLRCSVIGGTSVTIDPEHGSTITTATKLLPAADAIASASTSGEIINTFNDATLAAGDFLRLKTTAISGTPTQISITVQYRLT